MHESRGVDRSERARQIHADARDFFVIEQALFLQFLLERAAADEFHPQSDASIDPIRAVDRDDIGMTNAREQAPFFDRRHRVWIR